MLLADSEIAGMIDANLLGISPFSLDKLGPCSYDLTLGAHFFHYKEGLEEVIVDRPIDTAFTDAYFSPFYGVTIPPRGVLLATTEETLALPPGLVGHIHDRLSISKTGLLLGGNTLFQPGSFGKPTLTLTNVSSINLRVLPGVLIASISFELLHKPASRPYGHPARPASYIGADDVQPPLKMVRVSPAPPEAEEKGE